MQREKEIIKPNRKDGHKYIFIKKDWSPIRAIGAKFIASRNWTNIQSLHLSNPLSKVDGAYIGN